MSLIQQIEDKIIAAFDPHHLEVENESHNHSGNRTDSHFRLVIVSDEFDGVRLIGRHRKVNALMADELANGIHALALHTFTLKEWQDRGQSATRSPVCASKLK
mgnify:CR=1 FL=1